MNLRNSTTFSEQCFITMLGIPSSPTDFDGCSRFVTFSTPELKVGAKDESWLKEENILEQEATMNRNRLKIFWIIIYNNEQEDVWVW